MSPNRDPSLSGQQLLADYQAAFVNRATASVAKAEAERSESMVLDQLASVSAGGYLQPGNLNQAWQTGVTRESIDAHIKKIQAKQLESMSAAQLQAAIEQDKAYHNHKVRVTVLHPETKPLEAVWFNRQNGYQNGSYNRMVITGAIEEVLLDRNALVIKPTFVSRTFIPSLHFYVAYIINPDTMEPMVKIDLL